MSRPSSFFEALIITKRPQRVTTKGERLDQSLARLHFITTERIKCKTSRAPKTQRIADAAISNANSRIIETPKERRYLSLHVYAYRTEVGWGLSGGGFGGRTRLQRRSAKLWLSLNRYNLIRVDLLLLYFHIVPIKRTGNDQQPPAHSSCFVGERRHSVGRDKDIGRGSKVLRYTGADGR